MEILDYIFKVSIACYIMSLIGMYSYLLKFDKKTSVYPLNICSNYAEKTKKKKGKTGLLYYLNQLSGVLAILSIVIPFIISLA